MSRLSVPLPIPYQINRLVDSGSNDVIPVADGGKQYCNDPAHKNVQDCLAAAKGLQEPVNGNMICLLYGVRNGLLTFRRIMQLDNPSASVAVPAMKASAGHLWQEFTRTFGACVDYFVEYAPEEWLLNALEAYADFGDAVESRNASLVLEALEAQKVTPITIPRQRRLEQALLVGGPVQFLYAKLAGHLGS